MIALISGGVLLAGCLFLMLVSLKSVSCWAFSGVGCSRYAGGHSRYEYLVHLAWPAFPYLAFVMWRLLRLRITTTPYIVFDELKLYCREWRRALLWTEIATVHVEVTRKVWFLPWLGNWYLIRIRAKSVQADAAASGIFEGIKSAIRLEAMRFDEGSGRYALDVRGLDRTPAQIIDALRKRAGPRFLGGA